MRGACVVPGITPTRGQVARGLLAVVASAFLWCAGPAARGQDQRPGGADSAAPRSYWNKQVLFLPVQIDPAVLPNIQEVQLYVKDHPSKPWLLRDKAPPTQTAFAFRPTADGEYWFTVVTVDRAGKSTPPDLAQVVPHRLDGELAWTIGAGVAGTQMPAFGTMLLDSERWELVSFLRSRWPLVGQ